MDINDNRRLLILNAFDMFHAGTLTREGFESVVANALDDAYKTGARHAVDEVHRLVDDKIARGRRWADRYEEGALKLLRQREPEGCLEVPDNHECIVALVRAYGEISRISQFDELRHQVIDLKEGYS